MRFLSVAERELRGAARRAATYRIRWLTAAVFFLLLVWMIWVFDGFRSLGAGPKVFQAFSVVIFFYCTIVGAMRTADCLSWEKRGGTLGLLFLTNLNSAEIVAGKLCSSALAAVYGFFAVFPLLALPVLMGGVAFDYFWRTVLALVNAQFFSLAAGFLASVLCVRQFPAVAVGIGLTLTFSLGIAGVAEVLRIFKYPNSWVEGVALFSPIYTLDAAERSRLLIGQNYYGLSLAAVASVSWSCLALAVWRLSRTWRDRPGRLWVFSLSNSFRNWRKRGAASRVARRRRLLRINPFFWLASRQRVSAPVFLLVSAVLVVVTVRVTTPYFGTVMGGGLMKPLLGHLFAWFWTGLAINALALYYAATAASQRLAEDKQTGALELILSTPATERSISRGLWLAYGRAMFAPLLVVVLVHFFFIWHGCTLFLFESAGQLRAGLSTGQLLWIAVSSRQMTDYGIEWHFVFILRMLLLALVVIVANWFAVGWVGRWLGLRMKHPGFAPLTTVTVVLFPPWLLFALVCYVCDELHLDRTPERQFLPILMWVAFGIGLAHCFLLSTWVAGRLRRDFRTTVTRRFQPPSPWRWWRPSRLILVRFAIGTTALTLTVLVFYGYQNWRSRKAWAAFQADLKRRGESLDLAALLPGPVADDQNFARTLVFQNLLNLDRAGSSSARSLFSALARFESGGGFNVNDTNSWFKQGFTDFNEHLAWVQPGSRRVRGNYKKNSVPQREAATTFVEGLEPLSATLHDATAAARLPFFQATTGRNAEVVFHGNQSAFSALDRLQFLFQLRACAFLELNRQPEAADDLVTSLRLARLARQSPEATASIRVQGMLVRSLQALWEGLAEQRWNEEQLAAFQSELAMFNLLADYTNSISRVVRAYVEVWQQIPDVGPGRTTAPPADWSGQPAPQLQPRAWWFDNCIQLCRAAERAINRVDVRGARVRSNSDWSDLEGLPLDGNATQLLQQAVWWGAHPTSVAFAQTALNQAILACALERYRLARGEYPDNLEQLVPAYLDSVLCDTITGRPMNYRRTDNASYVLRGAGPNEINDENKAASDDWLWTYPAPTNAPRSADR